MPRFVYRNSCTLRTKRKKKKRNARYLKLLNYEYTIIVFYVTFFVLNSNRCVNRNSIRFERKQYADRRSIILDVVRFYRNIFFFSTVAVIEHIMNLRLDIACRLFSKFLYTVKFDKMVFYFVVGTRKCRQFRVFRFAINPIHLLFRTAYIYTKRNLRIGTQVIWNLSRTYEFHSKQKIIIIVFLRVCGSTTGRNLTFFIGVVLVSYEHVRIYSIHFQSLRSCRYLFNGR